MAQDGVGSAEVCPVASIAVERKKRITALTDIGSHQKAPQSSTFFCEIHITEDFDNRGIQPAPIIRKENAGAYESLLEQIALPARPGPTRLHNVVQVFLPEPLLFRWTGMGNKETTLQCVFAGPASPRQRKQPPESIC